MKLFVIALVISSCILASSGAPAFKLKHYPYYKQKEITNSRIDRRIIGGSSPIHFISPFLPMSESVGNQFGNYISPAPAASSLQSTIYKLPLRLLANGRLNKIIHGFPKKRQQFLDQLSHAASNIIHLPLKYVSNAKPVKVFFPDPSFNYL